MNGEAATPRHWECEGVRAFVLCDVGDGVRRCKIIYQDTKMKRERGSEGSGWGGGAGDSRKGGSEGSPREGGSGSKPQLGGSDGD